MVEMNRKNLKLGDNNEDASSYGDRINFIIA